MPVRILTLSHRGCFDKQPSQLRVALLAYVTQTALVRAGGLFGNQSKITSHLSSARESPPVTDGQHVRQGNDWTHSRVTHQTACFLIPFSGLADCDVQRSNLLV